MFHFLGCLLFAIFFIFVLGVALLGNVLHAILRLFLGSNSSSDNSYDRTSSAPKTEKKNSQTNNGYTFKPEDGEYVDFEEV